MAATTDLILKNLANGDITFTPSVAIPNGYQYRDLSIPLPGLGTLDVSHKIAPMNSVSNSVHIVRIAKTTLNAAGQPRLGYVEYRISHPRDAITEAHMADSNAEMKSLMSDANFKALMMGKF